MYKLDKAFCAKFLTVKSGSNLSYYSQTAESKQSAAETRKSQRKRAALAEFQKDQVKEAVLVSPLRACACTFVQCGLLYLGSFRFVGKMPWFYHGKIYVTSPLGYSWGDFMWLLPWSNHGRILHHMWSIYSQCLHSLLYTGRFLCKVKVLM